MMPLEFEEKFLAKLQKGNRVQIPVLVRWRHKLKPREVFKVQVAKSFIPATFYGRLTRDGRLTIPKTVIQEIKAEPGDILNITLLQT